MIPRHFFGALFLCLIIQNSLLSFQNNYTGVWEFTDKEGSPYMVHIDANHTVVSTYKKGAHAIFPQEGYWRMNGDELHILYKNGLMDVLKSTKNGYSRTSYSSGTVLDKKGGQTSVIFKTGRKTIWASISEKDFTGYWKLLDEEERPFYLHLQEDHTARSTYSKGNNGLFGERGTWRFEQSRVMILYDSGWIDIINKTGNRYTKFSFAPGQRLSETPNNTSIVEHVKMEDLGVKAGNIH